MGSLLPQDLSYFDSAPIKSTGSIDCVAPVEVVFAVLADHRTWPSWVGMGVTAAEPTSKFEKGIGSTRRLVVGWGAMRVEERFIAWNEPTVWAFTAISCRPKVFRKLVEGFWLESRSDGGSAITYRMGCEVSALLMPGRGAFDSAWTRAIKRTLPKLSAEAIRRHQE